VIDLGAMELISSIEAGFLQDIKSWIFYPPTVEYYTSEDGENFTLAGSVACDFPDNQEGAFTKNFILSIDNAINARYVKVVAKNYGVCPDWHLGAGGVTWVFADEITIK